MSHPKAIREKILSYIANGGKILDALEIFNVSRSSYQRWSISKEKTGSVDCKPRVVAPYKINNDALSQYIIETPDAYLTEIAAHFNVTQGCISAALERLKISRKKKSMLYQERNREKRAKYIKEIEIIPYETLLFIDEAGIDKFLTREYARGIIGKRVYGECSGKRYHRESFIAGKIDGKVIAPFCYEGTCNTELFNFWLENMLLPELTPGTTLILDNASIHKSEKTKDLISSYNCKLIFLPPYSPDLNPIEKVWAQLKAIIRKSIKSFKSLSDAIDFAFRSIIQI